MQEKTTKRTITGTSINLLVAATVSVLALASPAVAADKLIPFNGSLNAQEAISAGPSPGTFVADGTGGGIATLIGRFTLTWKFTVTIADGTGLGPVRFTAANGDEIFTTAAGISWPADTPGLSYSGDPDHNRWYGSVRRRERNLRRGALDRFEYGRHLRFFPGDHDFAGCRQLRVSVRAVKTHTAPYGLRRITGTTGDPALTDSMR